MPNPRVYSLLFLFGVGLLSAALLIENDLFYTLAKPIFSVVVIILYLIYCGKKPQVLFVFGILGLICGSLFLIPEDDAYFKLSILGITTGCSVFLWYTIKEIRSIPKDQMRYRDLPLIALLIALLFYIVYSSIFGEMRLYLLFAALHLAVLFAFSVLAYLGFVNMPNKPFMWLMFAALSFIIADMFYGLYAFKTELPFLLHINFLARLATQVFMLRFILAKRYMNE